MPLFYQNIRNSHTFIYANALEQKCLEEHGGMHKAACSSRAVTPSTVSVSPFKPSSKNILWVLAALTLLNEQGIEKEDKSCQM